MRTRGRTATQAAQDVASTRHMPQRAVKIKSSSSPGLTPRNGGRVTRSKDKPSFAVSLTDDESENAELSSEDDFRARNTSRKRPNSSHYGPSSRRPKRIRHDSGYYDEDDEEPEDESEDENEAGVALLSPPLPSPTVRKPTRRSFNTPKRNRRTGTHAAKKSPSLAKVTLNLEHSAQESTSAVIPPWAALPYYTLVRIFESAAHPLNDISEARWLVSASRICRAFAEPALTALYTCPPLLTLSMAHNLNTTLAMAPSHTMFGYRQKIRRLEIDVGHIATLTYKGRVLDLKALIQGLSKLEEVDLFHHKDMSPYRQLDENLRWHYPSSLFEAMGIAALVDGQLGGHLPSQDAGIRLKSWRWSSRMMNQQQLSSLGRLHETKAFQGLQKVSFVNYQLPSLSSSNPDDPEVISRDQKYVQHLAASVSALPLLTHLVMESSTVVNDSFLPLLPKNIQHLELINCWEIKAEDFSEYLISHGRELRSLTLHHNQSLSLGFLPVLGVACPNLQHLRMNFTYYNHHEFYNDSDPVYEFLLTPGQLPTWPATLEIIELEHLRKWSPDAAEMLFQSLVDSARNLSMLRHLNIKAMLDIPWRQRCQIRDKWAAKLNDVFKRKWVEPKPFRSLRGKPGGIEHVSPSKKQKERHHTAPSSPTRRSNRIATQPSAPSSRASSAVRDLRRVGAGRIRYTEPETDDDVDIEDGDFDLPGPASSTPHADADSYVQGMCEIVDIRLDNQKPTERQYGMGDFLDSDDASDDEWNGDQAGDDDYAW